MDDGLLEEEEGVLTNGRSNGHSKLSNRNSMQPFELCDPEEEMDSLQHNSAELPRCFCLLGTLAFFVLITTEIVNLDVSHDSLDHSTQRTPQHGSSLGGNRNPGHYEQPSGGANNDDDLLLPNSNVGHAVVSVSVDNNLNYNGHYWHDHVKSPFTSPLYARDSNETAAIQQDFEERMKTTVAKYGQWETLDATDLYMHDFTWFDYGDLPGDLLPPNAWQLDDNYVTAFLRQAKNLVARVQEGIYAEYGFDADVANDTKDAILQEREKHFQVILDPFDIQNGTAVNEAGDKLPGIAHLNKAAWEGLIRKLLHAVMTGDDFYVVVAGPAGTYRANNFFQTQVMQFNSIMEPVLDKLGVRLIARNMGMDASTTVSALGGADIYGEADILWYVADTRDGVKMESLGQFDLLHKQAILSGERMPVILTPAAGRLLSDTKGKAWIGDIQPGADFCEETTVKDDSLFLPAVQACQYLRCTEAAKASGKCDKYDSVCWVDRTDWNASDQDKNVGMQHEGYPNIAEHRWEGRKLAMLVLRALDKALERWSIELAKNVTPLPDDLWHVGPVYEELRESVRTLEREPGTAMPLPACERLLKAIDPMICHMSMHAYTEWTPRVNPERKRIQDLLLQPIPDNHATMVELYKNVDLLPLQWKVPKNEVDVHMIAIATNASADENATGLPLRVVDSYYDDYDGYAYGDDMDDYLDDLFVRRRLLSAQSNRIASEQSSVSRLPKASEESWTVYNAPIGFCDGSAQSRCNRIIGSTCLLANYNHYKAGILGHGNSGWLNMSFPSVQEGIILARFDWDLDIGRGSNDLPSDFAFDYAIHGHVTTLNRDKFLDFGVKIVGDLIVYPLLIDKEMSHEEGQGHVMDVAIRIRSNAGADSRLLLTHIYYA